MDPTLRRLVQGQLQARELLAMLDPSALHVGLADLCRNSLGVAPEPDVRLAPPAPGQVEWGSCIVLDKKGLELLHWVEGQVGKPHEVEPACEPENHKPPLVYVGFAHTHLPRKSGKPYPGFSPLDFRAALEDGSNLELVCNGPEVFALVRTADRTQPRRKVSDPEFAEWQQRLDAWMQWAREEKPPSPLYAALWQFNREMCHQLGFALYYGVWGQPLVLIYRLR
jgi:hypothetical protein